jgi:hypothetical protein
MGNMMKQAQASEYMLKMQEDTGRTVESPGEGMIRWLPAAAANVSHPDREE